MAKHTSQFVSLNKGQTLTGKVTKLTSGEVLVNINAKTEAVVLERDKRLLRNILSSLKVGDEVSVYILDPESDMGNPVVSLRKFMEELTWGKLENLKKDRKEIEVLVTEVTRGGFLAQTNEGVSGFLPNSHVISSQNPQEVLNKKIKAFILELDRKEQRVIFSQKVVMGVEDFAKAIKDFKIEQKMEAIVTSLTPFGIFVTLPTKGKDSVDGLIHISEISWEKVDNIGELFTVGQKVAAQIIGFDREAKRVDLSIRRLTKDPFDQLSKKYSIDQKVKCEVLKIISTGVLIKLNDSLEGFIRKEKIPPTVSFKTGDKIDVMISEIDKKRHRIIAVPVLLEKPIGYR
ncbi:MAG: S1 RNA-binding domain-containing protein [Patescibacteria group bacterium]